MNKKQAGTSPKRPGYLAALLGILAALLVVVCLFAGTVINTMNLGLDLQGGFEIAYQVSPLEEGGDLPETSAIVASIRKRIDVLGVSEPEITVEGNNQIRVQLAGVKDQDEARKVISSTANLTFRDSSDNLLMDASVLEEGGASLGYQNGSPVVELKIKDTETFYSVTSQVASSSDQIMVVWLDYDESESYEEEHQKELAGGEPAYISAATVSQGISGDAVISGSFTEEEARTLANLINSGSLPVKLTEIYSNVVSAELGESAYQKTMLAGGIGILLVMAFMILMYRLPGVISAGILPVYVFAVLGLYKLMGGVFTLPGIAALVLGVGMAVDSNILTFERLKEELYMGRKLETSIYNSQKTSLAAIVDAQLTTFIAALIMYIFGTGSVKGFATMLMLTLFCTVFISILLVRALMNLLAKSHMFDDKPAWFGVRADEVPDVERGEKPSHQNPWRKIDFLRQSKKFVAISLSIFALCAVMLIVRGSGGDALNLGIDFSSGTRITIESDETLTTESVTEEFESLGFTPSRIQLSGENNTGASVYLKESLDQDTLTALKSELADYYGHEASDSVVTPTVGRALVKNAFYLTLLAWACMLLYISLRFRWDFAVGAIVALIHDVLMVFAAFAILNFEINSDLIAVFLAIIGYSINNSIVVFDRIRDELQEARLKKQTPELLKELLNTALANTFNNSVNSTITTLLPVICLLIWGSSSIFTFNFAFLVGLIAGMISSLFIAGEVWYKIRCHEKPKAKKKKKKKSTEVEEFIVPGINDIR